MTDRVVDTLEACASDRVAGETHHEKTAEPLVEDQLRWHARVRTRQDDRERRLSAGKLRAPFGVKVRMPVRVVLEAPVALD
jgi:hypothetical protein